MAKKIIATAVGAEPEVQQVAEHDIAAWQSKGSDLAVKVQKQALANTQFALDVYKEIAKVEQKDLCKALIDGYEAKVVALQKVGTVEARAAAKTAATYVSRMRKVYRSVWGTGDGKTAKPGIGAKETLAILTGKGTVNDKLQALPSSGEGRKPRSAEVAIQSRVAVSAGEVMIPSMESLVKAVGVKASKVDNEATMHKAATIGLVQTIKATPESLLNDMLQACIDRLRNSPDKMFKDMGETFADHWTKLATVEALAPARKTKARVTAQAGEPAKQ